MVTQAPLQCKMDNSNRFNILLPEFQRQFTNRGLQGELQVMLLPFLSLKIHRKAVEEEEELIRSRQALVHPIQAKDQKTFLTSLVEGPSQWTHPRIPCHRFRPMSSNSGIISLSSTLKSTALMAADFYLKVHSDLSNLSGPLPNGGKERDTRSIRNIARSGRS